MTRCDSFGRPIQYLRISVTDRCNLRCVYCMPANGVPVKTHGDILRYEEIVVVAQAAAELGISKVRLTGGEPLARLGLADLVRQLSAIPGLDDLSMTTNGTLLSRFADELADAGLQRVNISLDTLRPERFAQITRLGKLEDALAGIEAAHRAGLRPVKINSVIIRGLNEDEILDLAQKTVTDGWNLRFIEWMPIGEADLAADWSRCVVTTKEIRDQVEAALGALTPAKPEQGGGPARYYRLPHATGTVGFVSPITAHFCHSCNRLRLTADGQLRPCLLSDQEIDLRTPLRAGAGMQQIKDLLLQGIEQKPMQHHLDQAQSAASRTMAQIGG